MNVKTLAVMLLSLLLPLLPACTIGKGYVFEAGLNKCTQAKLGHGMITVDPIMGPTVTLAGENLSWHTVGQQCKDVNVQGHLPHGDKAE